MTTENKGSVYAESIKNYSRCLEKNTLIKEVEVKAYRISIPDQGSMGSFHVIFTPAGICIHGDWCPLRHGVCSDPGYGEGWFSEKKSDSYLAEKFLETGWHPELAIEEMRSPDWWGRESLVEQGKEDQLPKINELCERLESGDLSSKEMGARLYDELDDMGLDVWEDLPGCGYDPRQLGMLVAIHRKFVELKAEHGEGK